MSLSASPLGPNLWIGSDVRIGTGVQIGANVVLHDGVVLEDGAIVDHGAVIGKPPRLGPHSRALIDPALEAAETVIGPGAAVSCGAVVCAGAVLGARAVAGDHSLVREGARLGLASVLGHGGAIGSDVEVGARVRIQNNAIIAGPSRIEDDVFVGPSLLVVHDNSPDGREHGASPRTGVILRRGCRIGGAVVFLPGLEVGERAFVAAGSLVTRDVPAGMLVMGSPARVRGGAPGSPGF